MDDAVLVVARLAKKCRIDTKRLFSSTVSPIEKDMRATTRGIVQPRVLIRSDAVSATSTEKN